MSEFTRRNFLECAMLPIAALPLPLWAGVFPTQQPDRALFPCPQDGAEVGVNPPGFGWWRAEGATSYRLVIRDASGRQAYSVESLTEPVHLPNRALSPGTYTWDVEACDARGNVLAKRGTWRFIIAPELPELAWENPKDILARIPREHPRYILLRAQLPGIIASLKAGRKKAWEYIRESAERALNLPLPEAPQYHTFSGENRARMGYVVYFREFRRRVDIPLSALSLAYLLSGEERYGLRAKRMLLEIESWGIEGPMSLLSPFGDEPGLSMSRHGQRAYDWLYDLFTPSERERIRNMTAARARQILQRLRKARYLTLPSESHNGRLIAYLSEYAIILKDEVPDAAEWLEYSLQALTTFYPHWGGYDGGWAEGISYAISYNSLYLGAIESLRAAAGIDLYKRPFYRNIRRFFLYCTSPIGEMKPFGDGSEGGVGDQAAMLLAHHGQRFNDPACVWWANQVGRSIGGDPLIPMLTQDSVSPQPPRNMPQAAVFRGVGWAAMHSALEDPKQDTFLLFKSSPYGSVSHSHADQNSFTLMKGGQALAIPSGYYGPAYGMPHHAEWTRQTKANNCILVNDQGQIVREATAAGRIAEFKHQANLTYVCGDAAAAYGGKLKRFLRHVLFLRPGVFCVLDELTAVEAVQFSWLLHAFDKMELDPAVHSVESSRGNARLTVRLRCDAGLTFSQTDQFDTPFNAGNPDEYHQTVANQWHFAARTEQRQLETSIAAVMLVRSREEKWRMEWKTHPGWFGISLEMNNGAGEAWIRTTSGAPAPAGVLATSRLSAVWRPTKGSSERMEI